RTTTHRSPGRSSVRFPGKPIPRQAAYPAAGPTQPAARRIPGGYAADQAAPANPAAAAQSPLTAHWHRHWVHQADWPTSGAGEPAAFAPVTQVRHCWNPAGASSWTVPHQGSPSCGRIERAIQQVATGAVAPPSVSPVYADVSPASAPLTSAAGI